MARKNLPWYLVFMAALVIGSVFWMGDLSSTTMLTSFALSDLFYQWLDKTQQRKWFVLYAMAAALLLDGLYYVADAVIFPQPSHAGHRLKSAALDALFAFVILVVAYRSPANKGVSLSA